MAGKASTERCKSASTASLPPIRSTASLGQRAAMVDAVEHAQRRSCPGTSSMRRDLPGLEFLIAAALDDVRPAGAATRPSARGAARSSSKLCAISVRRRLRSHPSRERVDHRAFAERPVGEVDRSKKISRRPRVAPRARAQARIGVEELAARGDRPTMLSAAHVESSSRRSVRARAAPAGAPHSASSSRPAALDRASASRVEPAPVGQPPHQRARRGRRRGTTRR